MPHSLEKLIRDLQRFVAELQEFRGKRSLEELQRDTLHLRAVEMQFVLIAEVLKRMKQQSPEVSIRIDRLREITGMRNTIVHDYDDVDVEIVHDAATVDVPVLKQQIDAWAAELGMEAPPERAS